ncbi:12742_t:CDS:1 [Acaulospora colombiana]|uniref:12742_t:CDS:1 n=1 Tax=Acaulospora colombiana TaxID=27376 RepID=A0ACA9LHZ5_9GLOM|nr:12742_t:CDS:1 [Acaulospora colombiana]
MSLIFSGCIITFSGVFEAGNHSKLQTIVKEHGAVHSSNLTKKTTHLVITKEDYEKGSAKVASAKARAEEVSIVTWRWVEDSISQKCKLDESKYFLTADANDGDVDMNDASGVDKDDKQSSKGEVSRKRKRTVKAEESDAADEVSTIVASSSSQVVTTKKKRKTKAGTSSTGDQTETVDVKVVEEKKMVTIIKKGRAPVDPLFPEKNCTHVYSDDTIVWDCLLNQTNVADNNNKFFVIQLLKHDSANMYFVFTRWGRVGYDGQKSTLGPLHQLEMAKREFEKKFRDKTRNSWIEVCQDGTKFVAYKGKYTLLERDYGDDCEDTKDEVDCTKKGKGKVESAEPPEVPESKLHPKVQDIIRTIFDISAFSNTMVELNYDATKLPLGKLSKNTIIQGYQVLKKIEAVLTGKDSYNIEELSNDFYSVIPHNFGMRKPALINSEAILKQKLDMVEALGEIEIATSLIRSSDNNMNELDSHYNSLRLERMVPLDHDSEEFKLLLRYVKNTQGATHNSYTLEILDAFDIEREGERSRYEKYSNLHNRMLLWHGSRKTNFAGILSQGLRIAPPHVPCTGYMFGKGVYFADCVSKSANYCYTSNRDNVGFMLLCEVACGDMLELVHGDFNAGEVAKKQGKHCTKGMGQTVPDPKDFFLLENGTTVPCGNGKCINLDKFLMYNEYIVYDVDQILQKYLLKVKFNYRW